MPLCLVIVIVIVRLSEVFNLVGRGGGHPLRLPASTCLLYMGHLRGFGFGLDNGRLSLLDLCPAAAGDSLESTLVGNASAFLTVLAQPSGTTRVLQCGPQSWAMATAWATCWRSSAGPQGAWHIQPIAIGIWTSAITGTDDGIFWSWENVASCMRGMSAQPHFE